MPTLSDPVWLIHLMATAGMAGVLWTVQLAVYPLFDAVGRAEFPGYHRRYTTRITAVVVPLMCLETGTAAWLVFTGLRTGGFMAALGLLGLACLDLCRAGAAAPAAGGGIRRRGAPPPGAGQLGADGSMVRARRPAGVAYAVISTILPNCAPDSMCRNAASA